MPLATPPRSPTSRRFVPLKPPPSMVLVDVDPPGARPRSSKEAKPKPRQKPSSTRGKKPAAGPARGAPARGASALAPPAPAAFSLPIVAQSSGDGPSMIGGMIGSIQSLKLFGGKGALSCARIWQVGVACAVALVLLTVCTLTFYTLFAPHLARVHEPLVLLSKGGERLVLRVSSPNALTDPMTDLTHPRLAGRRALMRYFQETS